MSLLDSTLYSSSLLGTTSSLLGGSLYTPTIYISRYHWGSSYYGNLFSENYEVYKEWMSIYAGGGDDTVNLYAHTYRVDLGSGNDVLNSTGFVCRIDAGSGDDIVTLDFGAQCVFLEDGNDTLMVTGTVHIVDAGSGNDRVTLRMGADQVDLSSGNDTLTSHGFIRWLHAGSGNDLVMLHADANKVELSGGNDTLVSSGFITDLHAGSGNDKVVLYGGADVVDLSTGDDTLFSTEFINFVDGGSDNDSLFLSVGANQVELGSGNDTLNATGAYTLIKGESGDDVVSLNGTAEMVNLGEGADKLSLVTLITAADGNDGLDELEFSFNAGDVDIFADGSDFTFFDRFSGERMDATAFETVTFADRSFTAAELVQNFGTNAPVPFIQVGGGTQVLTINDVDPSISVIWDRVVQQAVIENDGPGGPTIASRAYAMMHTAMYDAWSSYDSTAVRVSFDLEGDNLELIGGDLAKEKAMSYAAITVLEQLFPDQTALFTEVMENRLGYSMTDDGSVEAQVGIDAAQDILALRLNDGANQAGGFQGAFTPLNPSPLEINDITRWTPENVPIDPEDANVEQSFLTPQWKDVESFALLEDATGETDFSAILPPAPQSFFTEAFAGSSLDFAARTITLDAAVSVNGVDYMAGDVIDVSKDLIGTVINQGFINQAEQVVEFSANLTDEQKIIAEFWEDGGGTAFPPGTFMGFAQFVSARDNNSLDDDAFLFLAMSNAVMDAGIATWQAKVEYDYARPVRAIRDLGELGLIGEEGVDELTGETGFVIQAFGGFDANGMGLGTRTILADNFNTFQRPGADPSPPFSEYTSGHSGFSAAGAQVLAMFTGSDEFGGFVTFEPDTIQFENGVPENEVTLAWSTFSDAADEAGLSRLYGGIHFEEGDLYGRALGRAVGESAYENAMRFVNGTATDADRPFFEGDLVG